MRCRKLALATVITGSVILSSAYAPPAEARPIIYNETVQMIGPAFVGGVEYDNAIVTETGIGDTTGAFMPQPGVWENALSSVSFSVLGHLGGPSGQNLTFGTRLEARFRAIGRPRSLTGLSLVPLKN
jgi:hypothetical protein